MERIFDFNRPLPNIDQMQDADIQLLNLHLILNKAVADKFVGDQRQVYAVYAAEQNKLLLTHIENKEFKAQHKPLMLFVKQKNLKGDKSISLQEFFADSPHLDQSNRKLESHYDSTTHILEIYF